MAAGSDTKATDWFVLRTSGRSTLPLAGTLEQDGFEVWTPVRRQRITVPRLNVKREIATPLLPSFVFVRSHHLAELLAMARNPSVKHRAFTVFHYLDGIPLIADRHLDPLRTKEREAVPTKDRVRFDRGAKVRVGTGAFEGLKGRVERCRDGYALVIFTDWKRPVKIPTFLLAEDTACSATKPTLKAA